MTTEQLVYCQDCRFHERDDSTRSYCRAPAHAVGDWKTPVHHYRSPHECNRNNDCPEWKHKRGLIEWLNDLIEGAPK